MTDVPVDHHHQNGPQTAAANAPADAGSHAPEAVKIAVVTASDAAWTWQSLFVLSRSIERDPGNRLDHHMFIVGEPDRRVLAHLPARVTLHSVEALPAHFAAGASGHVPAATLLRLLVIEQLSESYDRVLYLDGDVYQDWGALADIAAIDLQGSAVGAVRNRSHWFTDPEHRYNTRYAKALSAEIGDRYFNAGVLLVEAKPYLARDISGRAAAFLGSHPQLCRFGDQSALNAVLAGDWAKLSPGWNWQMSKTAYGLTGGRCPRLIHFTGPIKPWSDRYRLYPPEIFSAMLSMLEEFGLAGLLPDSAPIHYQQSMERVRTKMVSDWAGELFEKRERIKAYLKRTDFADTRAGLAAFR